MLRGRKVTDPVVHGASGGRETVPGLAKAWDSVGKAKSDLRKIEQRLVEHQHPLPQLNQTGETSITDYGGLAGPSTGNTDKKDIPEAQTFASGAVVDNYGRSAYLRSKTQTSRKISRLDDKYVEDNEKGDSRKPSFKKPMHRQKSDKQVKQTNLKLREKNYNTDRALPGSRDGREKRVEFSDRVVGSENHMDRTYGIPERPYSPNAHSTLTNSRDIRETEIHFLNNNLTQSERDNDVRWSQPPKSKLTHVSVTVPGSTNTMSSTKYTAADLPHNGAHFLDLISDNQHVDHDKKESVSDHSYSDSESSRGRRFKPLKNIDPDGLAKIKETIQKQIKSSHKENHEDGLMGATGGIPNDVGPSHQLHDDHEPIIPRSQDLIEGSEKHPKVRKIAAGPALPHYKGFSEAEIKYKLVEKTPKTQDVRRKEKKAQVKVQHRRAEPIGSWLTVEEERTGDGTRKKITRVIAPSRKPTRQQPQPKNKEIITTSSWRAGQELILRELGPARKKTSRLKDTRDEDFSERSESPMEARPEALIGEEYPGVGVGSATAAEIDRHRALSEEAKRVYNDLQLDSEEEKRRTSEEKRRKAPVKRKAPKSAEPDKQALSAKQRHYDQDEVRRYMQRQKAERIRQQKEEEKRQKEIEDAKRKHLEELSSKQKQAAVASTGKREKSRGRGQDIQSKPVNSISDLPKHHPFHKDRARFMLSSESENKENHHDDADMDISDGSSTITEGESIDDLTPNETPRNTEILTDTANVKLGYSNRDNKTDTKLRLKSSDSANTNTGNVRTVSGFTFEVEGVMSSKFTQALHEKLNEEPRALRGNSGYASLNSQNNVNSGFSSNFISHDDIGYSQNRSRQDRLNAIKETAATLQNRLQEEKRKFQGDQSAGLNNEIGATNTRPAVRWNDQEERDDFVSRYERITAATDDFTVFRSNLPGTQPGQIRIEHSRQNDVGRKPARATTEGTRLGVTSGNRKEEEDIGEDVTLTETSTFSEITLTDESDTELSPRKPGTKETGYHASRKPSDKPGDLGFPRPGPSHQPKASSSWDETIPDPYNVFSIYSRRQQEKLIRPGREPMSTAAKRVASNPANEPLSSQSEHTTQATAPRTTSMAAPQSIRSKSPGASGRAEAPGRSLSPYGVSKSESLRTKSPVDKTKSRQMTVSFKPPDDHDSDEDTIGEESYTESFETEEKTVSRAKSASEKIPQSRRTLPTTSQKTQAAETESSMDEQDVEMQDATPRADSSDEPKEPPRLSPNSLERRFLAELHQLDSMEMSMKQLTGVERTRAISMAQQETVSLAQMLKARQQAHDLQMKELQNKAKLEASEATKQLEEAIKRASDPVGNMAEAIGRSRGQDSTGLQESTRKFFESQTEAVKATAEAAKLLSERIPQSFQDTKRLVAQTAAASAAAVTNAMEKRYQTDRQGATSERIVPESARTQSARTTTYSKPSKSTSKSATSRSRTEDGGSVRTVTGAEGHDDSESIGSADDYSIQFDESMTEDEREEKSFRLILPSESHRKKGRHIHSDNESVTSEGSRGHLEDLHSLFEKESFDKFTDGIVQQFMKEEELRAHHQASLLRLRENALVEKTKAELAWLEQQKQRIRNKGADDNYPQIVKRQRGLKMKLQEQQAEIRRLREANKAAARERQKHLYEEIAKKRQQATVETEPKRLTGRLGRPSEVHTEAEVSSIDEASDAEKRQRKDYKSDSEIYTEPKGAGKKSKTDSKSEKYRKINLDEKFLTQRQHRLIDRRKNAEELLKWKELLDSEENRVLNLEKKALKVWDQKEKDKSTTKQLASKKEETEPKLSSKNGTAKDSTIKTAASASVAQDSTIISENISTARDESAYTRSIKESPRLQTASSGSSPEELHKKMMNDKSNLKNHNRSGSESSVMEEIQSQSSESKKNDSSDDTMTHSYENETFDETTTTKKTSKSTSKSPLDKLKKYKNFSSPRSPFSARSLTRNSESESEDSISYTETQSDLSDFEGRIRALNEELRRRKTEADKLKRERKKKRRELMKNKEESLKKQIEAYDNQISQLKVELKKEMEHEPIKGTVKPQIKQPKVSPPKVPQKKTEVTPPKQKLETDSSGADSTQVSPSLQEEDKDQKLVSPQKTPVTSSVSSKVNLDRISEGSESPTSKSEKSTLREKLLSIKGSLSEKDASQEISEEIAEEIIEDISEVSEDKSVGIEINLKSQKEKEDMYDVTVSYTEDFTADDIVTGGTTLHERLALSPRSEVTEAEPKTVPLSARSGTEISEHISEAAGSISESFIKPLDFVKDEDIEKIIKDDKSEDQESDIDQSPSSITRTDSRPSSERSERSLRSLDLEHESSESDKSPLVKNRDILENELLDNQMSEPSRKSTGPVGKVLDIDDLLRMTDDMLDEETPVASPRQTPVEISQRDSDTPKMDETPRDDETPREIETPLDETPQETPRDDETPREEYEIHHARLINALADFELGDRVSVTGPNGTRNLGTLLFKGNVQFAPGIWAGVELDRPVGRHDGNENGVRYFRCRLGHGVIVPGHDLMPVPDEDEHEKFLDVRSSIESTTSMDGEDLINLINEADKNVQLFDSDSPLPSPHVPQNNKRRHEMADKITDHIFDSVMKENFNKLSEIADKRVGKKIPPPVAPKPKTKYPETDTHLHNGDIDDLEEFLQSPRHDTKEFESTAGSEVSNLMNDAIDHMLAIRNNRMGQDSDRSRDSGNFTDGVEDNEQGPSSPTEELEGVLNKKEVDEHAEGPVRPGSPVPGMQSQEDSHKHVVESGIFEGEFDDEFLVPTKAPPPYPGSESPDIRPEISRSELQKLTEELYYAVPHHREEVSDIVSSAVDTFWNQRRYGEPLEGMEPPSSYFSKEELGEDLISNSKRVFKRLLFDLTGEVIKDVYKEEEYDSPIAWHKPKRKQNKYYKGSSPPTTVDVLKPVVQEAVIDILGLNGSKKTDRSKWGIRKKKDLVDSILVQELREEEPQWVNYDDDELAVKMQLTETIFESLLTDTVQTMNKIFRKRQNMANQSQK